jgi:hypothetical protein
MMIFAAVERLRISVSSLALISTRGNATAGRRESTDVSSSAVVVACSLVNGDTDDLGEACGVCACNCEQSEMMKTVSGQREVRTQRMQAPGARYAVGSSRSLLPIDFYSSYWNSISSVQHFSNVKMGCKLIVSKSISQMVNIIVIVAPAMSSFGLRFRFKECQPGDKHEIGFTYHWRRVRGCFVAQQSSLVWPVFRAASAGLGQQRKVPFERPRWR